MEEIHNLYDELPFVASAHMDTVRVGQKLVCRYSDALIFPATIIERKIRKCVLINMPDNFTPTVDALKQAVFITGPQEFVELIHANA